MYGGDLKIGSLLSPNPWIPIPTGKWVYVKYGRGPDGAEMIVNTPDDEISTYISQNLNDNINQEHILFTCSSEDDIACEIDFIKVENK